MAEIPNEISFLRARRSAVQDGIKDEKLQTVQSFNREDLSAEIWSTGHQKEDRLLAKKLRGRQLEAFRESQLLPSEMDDALQADAAAAHGEQVKAQRARERLQDRQQRLLSPALQGINYVLC